MQYRLNFYTPFLRDIHPLAPLCGETITLFGDLFAVAFDDPDNVPDAENRQTNARDIFVRILAGGSACNHFDEDQNELVERNEP